DLRDRVDTCQCSTCDLAPHVGAGIRLQGMIRTALKTIRTVVVSAFMVAPWILMAVAAVVMVNLVGGGTGWIGALTDFGSALLGMLAVIAVGAFFAGLWDGIKRLTD